MRCGRFHSLRRSAPACQSGASIGFHRPQDAPAAIAWRELYGGYFPFRFQPDNFTSGLRDYYAFRQVDASSLSLVLELGEITCPAQHAWLAPRLQWEGALLAHFLSERIGKGTCPTPAFIVNRRLVLEVFAGAFAAAASACRECLAKAATYPIVLVVAPAGYGKTAAMDEYLESLEAHVRIDVRSKHQTPAAFAQSLCDAVPEGYRGIAAIDGLEIVQHDPEIAKHLVDAIEGTKSRVTWILASRSSDGLPIGTWLTYGDCERIIGAGDLRFTLEEAEGLTHHLGCEADDDELAGVLELTEGWPAAVHVALRSGSHPGENHKLLAAVRDATQRLWAEQVFPDLRDRERELLTVGALLPEIDVGLLVLAGFPDALQMLENVRRRTSLLEEGAGGTYRCATLFREFLRQRAELSGKDGQRVPHFLAARALETAGKVEAALDAYGAAQKKAEIPACWNATDSICSNGGVPTSYPAPQKL